MNPQRHHINRVVLDVAAPQPVLEQLETPLRHWQRERLPALLDGWLSTYAPAHQLLRLDQLVVDIADVDFTRLDREWTEKIEPRLREALRQALSRSATQTIPPAKQAAETLLFFLQTGRLPWHSDARATDTVTQLVREIIVDKTVLSTAFWQLLRQNLAAFRRLVQHLPDEQLAALFKQHLGLAALQASNLPKTSISLQARLDFWRMLMHQTGDSASIAGGNATAPLPIDTFKVPKQSLDNKSVESKSEKREAQDLLKTEESDDSDDRSDQSLARKAGNNRDEQDIALNQAVEKSNESKEGDPGEKHEAKSDETSIVITNQAQDRLGSTSAGGREAKRDEQRMLPTDASYSPDWSMAAPAQDADAWPLPNAGLVMIAPYLPALWTQLGWVKEGTLTSPEMRTLAIQMTAFLADGQEAIPPEYQLILPKILCGLQPDDLFEAQRALSVEEKVEGESLLSAVLEQAPGLGLKSIAGLRSAFLWREGLLRSASTHWMVQVAPETHDILLSRIPWGFQILKSEWMRVAVFVDWGRTRF